MGESQTETDREIDNATEAINSPPPSCSHEHGGEITRPPLAPAVVAGGFERRHQSGGQAQSGGGVVVLAHIVECHYRH